MLVLVLVVDDVLVVGGVPVAIVPSVKHRTKINN